MIAVVDYRAGNLTSVELALGELGQKCVVSDDRETILNADRLIFPGVGAAGSAMKTIAELNLEAILKDFAETGKPFLGICLGAQIILDSSLENNDTKCLGLIEGCTGLFKSTPEISIKIPQIGWNQVEFVQPHPLFDNIISGTEFYFVHSYYPVLTDRDNVFGKTVYGETEFASVLGRDNIMACQFHPEKSGKWGLGLLKNFCNWNCGDRSC